MDRSFRLTKVYPEQAKWLLEAILSVDGPFQQTDPVKVKDWRETTIRAVVKETGIERQVRTHPTYNKQDNPHP